VAKAKAKATEQVGASNAERPLRANLAKHIEVPSPSFASYYVNDVQIMTTPWDIRLRMGQIEDVNPQKGEATITVLADVRFSPQHAKKLAEILIKQLEGYETNVGPIPVVD
jgi:hypothetical protein